MKRCGGARDAVLLRVTGRAAVGRERPNRSNGRRGEFLAGFMPGRPPQPKPYLYSPQSETAPRARLRRRSDGWIASAKQTFDPTSESRLRALGAVSARSHHSAVFASFFLRQQKRKSPERRNTKVRRTTKSPNADARTVRRAQTVFFHLDARKTQCQNFLITGRRGRRRAGVGGEAPLGVSSLLHKPDGPAMNNTSPGRWVFFAPWWVAGGPWRRTSMSMGYLRPLLVTASSR